jgi:hypothetical protein
MKGLWLLAALSLVAVPGFGANELSLVKGVYSSKKVENKLTGSDQGSSNDVSLGAKLGLDMMNGWTHLIGGAFRYTSFSSGGSYHPDDMVGGSVSYGIRRAFPLDSTVFVPFATGEVSFKSEKTGEFQAAGFKETDTVGLFYNLQVGLRANVSDTFFVDFWAVMFESALFASSKDTIYSENGSVIEKDEVTRTELFADSASPLNDIVLGFGFHF